MSLPAEWAQLLEPEEPRGATKAQRRWLYIELTNHRPIVKSLTREEASRLIELIKTARSRGPV